MSLVPPVQRTPAANFVHYLQIIRRRLWILVVPLVVAPVLAYAFTAQQPAVYSATATVWFSPLNLATSLNGLPTSQDLASQPDRFASTQASIARAPEVAQIAVTTSRAHMNAQQFLQESSVAPEANADLLDFQVSNNNPRLAVLGATAYAKAFTQYSDQLKASPLQIALSDVNRRLAAIPAPDRKGALYANLLLRRAQIISLEVLQTSDTILVKAASAAVQVAPRPKRAALLGLAVGLLIALALVFTAEAVDNRVRGAAAVEAALGAPLLGRIPPNTIRGRRQLQEGLSMLGDRGSVQAEAFRVLRTSLDFIALKQDLRTLLVTSARPDEGKTLTVANLGIAFARSGRDVIVCDLDARKPSLGEVFGYAHARPGVTDVLLGQVGLDNALTGIEVSGGAPDVTSRLYEYRKTRAGREARELDVDAGKGKLRLLPFGTFRPPDPGAFISTDALRNLLADLRGRAELVIVDTAPVLLVGDALVLSADVDGILAVVRATRSTRGDLAEMRRLLDASPAPLIGFALTDTRIPDDTAGYGYGYGYGGGGSPLEARSRKALAKPAKVES